MTQILELDLDTCGPWLHATLVHTGGAFFVTFDNDDIFRDAVKRPLSKIGISVKPGAYIMYSKQLREFMGDKIFNAVIAHEFGHVHYGHSAETAALMTPKQLMQREFDADAYAADLVGTRTMIDALYAVMAYGIKVGFKLRCKMEGLSENISNSVVALFEKQMVATIHPRIEQLQTRF